MLRSNIQKGNIYHTYMISSERKKYLKAFFIQKYIDHAQIESNSEKPANYMPLSTWCSNDSKECVIVSFSRNGSEPVISGNVQCARHCQLFAAVLAMGTHHVNLGLQEIMLSLQCCTTFVMDQVST